MRRNYQSEGEMTKGHDKGHKGQMSDRDVMTLALEALEAADDWIETKQAGELNDKAIAALHQALEEPEQKPTAYMGTDIDGNPNKFRLAPFGGAIALYTKE